MAVIAVSYYKLFFKLITFGEPCMNLQHTAWLRGPRGCNQWRYARIKWIWRQL